MVGECVVAVCIGMGQLWVRGKKSGEKKWEDNRGRGSETEYHQTHTALQHVLPVARHLVGNSSAVMTKIAVSGPQDMKKKAPPKSTNQPAVERRGGGSEEEVVVKCGR